MINSFFFNYSSRIIQEYFQAKIGRKVRTLSLVRKNNILNYKKRVQVQKFYQSFDLGIDKSLIWQTSCTAYYGGP